MIVNFYKISGSYKSPDARKNQVTLIPGLTTLNLDVIPTVGTYIVASGQRFYVQMVELDADTAEWNVYVVRA